MNQKKQGGLTGVISLTASALFVKILGFFYKIPLSHALGDEGMGYYNSALNVYSLFFIICSYAIPKSLSVILSRARIYKTKAAYRKTFIFLSSFVSILGLSMTLLLFTFSRPLAVMIGISDADAALVFISPAIILGTASSVLRGYLLSYDRVSYVGISECIEAISKLFVGILFVFWGTKAQLSLPIRSGLAVLGITLGSLFSFLFLFIVILVIKKEESTFGTAGFSAKHELTAFLKVSLPLTFTSLLFSVSSILDVRLISHGLVRAGMTSNDAVRIYGNYSTLVLPLISFVNSIVSAFCLSLFPRLCAQYEGKREHDFKATVRSGAFILLCTSMILSLGFYFFGEDYFILLFKDESVSLGTGALKIVCVSVIFISLLNLFNTALEARGHSSAPLLTMGIGVLIKIPISMFMINKFGIMGAAYSTVISYLVAYLISFMLLRNEMRGFMPSVKEMVSCIFCAIFSFSFALFIKNLLIKSINLDVIRIIPIFLCCTLFLVFVLFISKNMSNNIRKLSQYTK